MDDLKAKKCKPCEGDIDPLTINQSKEFLRLIDKAWILSEDGKTIERRFTFPVYSRTIAFVNAVVWIAHNQNHHPKLVVAYGYCDVQYSTHAIDGLSENDFICAAKIDQLITEAD